MEGSGNTEELTKSEVRIGVFVCDCGTNIAGVVSVPEVVEYASALENVVFAEEGKWICAVDYLSKIKEYVNEHKLNRVVVACCTPRTHEPTFKTTVKEAGLNPFLLEFVSIREQSSWVHKDNPKAATEKAKDLVHMGVAKARFLKPGEELRIPVGKDCLVIGGGIAGITAALALGDLGFKVLLVEKSVVLGGLMQNLYKIAPSDTLASEILEPKIDRVSDHENITVYTNSQVTNVNGYIGNFQIEITSNHSQEDNEGSKSAEERKVSTIIVATGMNELEPVGKFGFGKYPNVVTQLNFEKMLKNNDEKLRNVKDIAFINCVNSRNSERGCCNVGCMATIKNIKAVKELNNKINAYQFFRDFNITGMDVQYHYEAMDKYSAAFRYPDSKEPVVKPISADDGQQIENGNRLSIQSYDILTAAEIKLDVDLVVLATGFKGDNSNEQLKGMLKVSTNADGFFQEAHVKLRPVDFANDGIFVCGAAKSPKDIRETLEESMGAAMRAALPMNRSYMETEGIVAAVSPEECISCGICTDVCAFSAVELVDHESNVIQAICKGCGICVSSCPADAISILHYTDEQILAQVDAALENNPEGKIITFACHWCALGAVDNAGVSRFEYPPNIRVIRVMCSGRVDPRFILRAFEMGAAGVLVAGCEFPTCHYMSGNYYAKMKVRMTDKLLELIGINTGRLRLEWLSAAEGLKFAEIANEFTEELTALGPVGNDDYSVEDLQAAISAVTDSRLKIIATKLKDFVEDGNRYGEVFSEHEVDRLLGDVVFDELISNLILNSIKNESKSVITISQELGFTPARVFKNILDLKKWAEVRVDKIEGNSTLYIVNELVSEDPSEPDETSMEPSEGTPEFKTEQKSIRHDFDYAILGTSTDALQKANELAQTGKTVCLVSERKSLTPRQPFLTPGFSDFSEYYDSYFDLIKEITQNENISIFRNTSITNKISTEESGSKTQLDLLKRATFVNEDKCNNCGDCQKMCPIKIIDFDAFGLSTRRAIDFTMQYTEKFIYNISKVVPYCQASCPILMDVRGYIGNIASSDIDRAAEVIRRTNPLPEICGRVCDHACEITCARGYFEEPLEIRKLKWHAMETLYDQYDESNRQIISKPSSLKNRDGANKVAVIGSGPAGLAAAHDLAMLGYPVTIFEAEQMPGGMLRMGIPDFRLPPEALEKEIDAILSLGVELKLNTPLGPNLSIDDLKTQGYKAIFLAIGAKKDLKLGVEGEDLEGVRPGLEFLHECNLNQEKIQIGNSVAVIGGGNVAIDCARTARRMGAEKVFILYRRTRNEMPAAEEELEECETEGVEIQYLVMPKKIIGESGKVIAIECLRTQLGEPDASGRRRPVPISDSEFKIDVDCVLSAIGQVPDLPAFSGNENFDLTKQSTFIVDENTGRTNVDCVFAGGDAISGPKNVIGAIRGGKIAALGIDEYLSGSIENNPNFYEVIGEVRTSEMDLLRLRKNQLLLNPEAKQRRSSLNLVDTEKGKLNFEPVEQPFSVDGAVAEAKRCLSCRMCIGCGVCQEVCPEDAIDFTMGDERFPIAAGQIISFPALTEIGIPKMGGLNELYKNSSNIITFMELEYMLIPHNAYNGNIMRPGDGEIPNSIAFINLPDKKLNTSEQLQLNNLELEYILKLMQYIKSKTPDMELKLFTNQTSVSDLSTMFEAKKNELVEIEDVKDMVVEVPKPKDDFSVKEVPENNRIEIRVKGETKNFDLVIVGAGMKFEN